MVRLCKSIDQEAYQFSGPSFPDSPLFSKTFYMLFLKSIVFRHLSLANTFFPILESEAPVTTELSFLQP